MRLLLIRHAESSGSAVETGLSPGSIAPATRSSWRRCGLLCGLCVLEPRFTAGGREMKKRCSAKSSLQTIVPTSDPTRMDITMSHLAMVKLKGCGNV